MDGPVGDACGIGGGGGIGSMDSLASGSTDGPVGWQGDVGQFSVGLGGGGGRGMLVGLLQD